MLAPRENSIVVAEKPPAARAEPHNAIDALAVKNDPTMAAAPAQSAVRPFRSYQSRHNMDDRPLTQRFVKTGVHRLRCRVLTANTYLVPAFVHLTAESGICIDRARMASAAVFTYRLRRR